jgi:dTDP-4-dehydrorhamnose reductase
MSKKVLVLGSTGMKGHAIYRHFKSLGYEVVGIASKPHDELVDYVIDVSNEIVLREFLSTHEFDFIINAIGLLVRDSREQIEEALYLNAMLPHIVIDAISHLDTVFIQLSTDCVFSGNKGGYIETDQTDGTRTYDMTKRLGEKINGDHLIVRSSVIGPEITSSQKGLFNWFLLGPSVVDGYKNAIWNGLSSFEFSRELHKLIVRKERGIVHVYSKESISKAELLERMQKVFHIDKKINYIELEVSTNKSLSSIVHTPSDLDYNQMLLEIKNEIMSEDLYRHLR